MKEPENIQLLILFLHPSTRPTQSHQMDHHLPHQDKRWQIASVLADRTCNSSPCVAFLSSDPDGGAAAKSKTRQTDSRVAVPCLNSAERDARCLETRFGCEWSMSWINARECRAWIEGYGRKGCFSYYCGRVDWTDGIISELRRLVDWSSRLESASFCTTKRVVSAFHCPGYCFKRGCICLQHLGGRRSLLHGPQLPFNMQHLSHFCHFRLTMSVFFRFSILSWICLSGSVANTSEIDYINWTLQETLCVRVLDK